MFLLRLFVILLAGYTHSIRSRSKKGAQILISNTNETLDCFFDLEGEDLYSILWWKEDAIIGRFLQRSLNHNTSQMARVKYWTKKISHYVKIVSNPRGEIIGTELVLTNIPTSYSGIYNCEVTAEGPYFHTINVTYDVQVISPPLKYPQLYGPKGPVPVGSIISACCYSPSTTKSSKIGFLINNKAVEPVFMTLTEQIRTDDSRVVLVRGVTFRLFRQLFQNDFLILECSVEIDGYPWKTSTTVWPDDINKAFNVSASAIMIAVLALLVIC